MQLYGGGPLSQSSGDILTDHGISIFMLYGCSECGIMSPILPKTSGKEWNYFKFPEGIKTRFVWDANGNAELLLLPGKHLIPNILNTVIEGLDAYATSDLLSPHPTKPGYWRIYGRADDQIMHNTGEKTNPGPLEAIMNQDLHVQAAVMFGRGKFSAGVVIDPRADFAFDPIDQDKLVEFRDKIWPTIERMNEYAPQHSRIFKEMIIVASPSKPFAYTAKNTARRQAIIADYDPEIEALYTAVEETTQADIPPPSTWNLPEATEFVHEVVTRVIKHSVQDSDDIFQKGCDSLQATWIRNTLLHALRDTTTAQTRVIPSAFVYQHPTINSLAAFISSFAKSEHIAVNAEQQTQKMLEMVKKYASFTTHTPSLSLPRTDTVVITGTTGSLGIELLGLLEKSSQVTRVYALNRKSSISLRQRHENSIRERGLDVSVLASEKIQLIEVDLEKEQLGISPSLYEEIRVSVTHIIHNAWPVNFNLSLESFEPNVRFLRDLVNLALSSPFVTPPRLVFISSIGVLRNVDTSVPVTEGPVDPSVAAGMGYSESKWVADSILDLATEKTLLRPVSIRVGQLTGGTSGAWNHAEWFPSLVRTSQSLNCLPKLEKTISWIPTNVAAKSILEMQDPSLRYLHLVHPRPVPWDTVITTLEKELQLPLVPYDQWLASLERVKADPGSQDENELLDRYPALKVLDFFADGGKENGSSEAMGMPNLNTEGAQRCSTTLRNALSLSEGDVLAWIAYWRKCKFVL
ncbi:hypothetical protein QCA50_019353 [Cerrena zonata]|uniref:Thioester reductase (TE) domain-containing protein n=1 Tax=Cerrena zonata TaxID=2478898 RepID=A0AAW0FCF4_9APHY